MLRRHLRRSHHGRAILYHRPEWQSRQDVQTNWLDLIKPIADTHDWGTGDLFPSFGLASLPAAAARAAMKLVSFKIPPVLTLHQVANSLARALPATMRRG